MRFVRLGTLRILQADTKSTVFHAVHSTVSRAVSTYSANSISQAKTFTSCLRAWFILQEVAAQTKLAWKPCTWKTDQILTRYRHHFDSPTSGGKISVVALIPRITKRVSQLNGRTLFGVNVIDYTSVQPSVRTRVRIKLIALTKLEDMIYTEFN
jgi:hypothetical protein